MEITAPFWAIVIVVFALLGLSLVAGPIWRAIRSTTARRSRISRLSDAARAFHDDLMGVDGIDRIVVKDSPDGPVLSSFRLAPGADRGAVHGEVERVIRIHGVDPASG